MLTIDVCQHHIKRFCGCYGNVIDSVNNSTMKKPLIARITIEEPELVDNQVWLTSSGHSSREPVRECKKLEISII
jgi:hypothetical protein